MTIIWCMVPEILRVTKFVCHFGPVSCPFTPPKNLKNQDFKKLKNMPGDIILHIVTYMTVIWCMAPEILSAMDIIFCHFTSSPSPLTTKKIKILRKWKKHLEILSFYRSLPSVTIMFGSWDTKHNGQNVLSF